MRSYCWGCVHSIISRFRISTTDILSVYSYSSSNDQGQAGSNDKGALGPGVTNGQMSQTGCFSCGDPSVQGDGCSLEGAMRLQKSGVNTTCLLVRRRRTPQHMVCGLFSSGTHPNLSTGGSPPFPATTQSLSKAGNLLLRGKKEIFVGTLNVRTLREQHKRDELGVCMRDSGVQILGIQEHRIVHSTEIEYQDLGNCYLITSSAWRTSNGAATGGVGIALDKKAVFDSLTSVYRHDRRTIVANFAGNPAVTVIATYSPTEGADIIEAEDYYGSLNEAIKQIPAHNMLYMVGDLNAHISPTGKWTSYHQGPANRNGRLLEDLLLERGLEICNTRFQKRRGKLWTYLSDMNQSKSQIDFIICRRKWRNTVKNCEAYGSFQSIGSDHRIVVARIKLSLRISKKPKRAPVPDWSKLKTDQKLQERYSVEVRNRFDLLVTEDQTPTERYQSFLDANNEASQLLLPKKEKKKESKVANDPTVQAVREELKQRSEKYHLDATEDNPISVKDGQTEIKGRLHSIPRAATRQTRSRARGVQRSRKACKELGYD